MSSNHKSIKFLRATRDAIVRNNAEQLSPGQPLYNIDDNYLTIGDNTENSLISKLPITVRELKGYFEDSNGIQNDKITEFHIQPTSNNSLEIKAPEIQFNIKDNNIIKLSEFINKKVNWENIENKPPIDIVANSIEDINLNTYKNAGQYIFSGSRAILNAPVFSNSNFTSTSSYWLEVEKSLDSEDVYQYITWLNWVGYRKYSAYLDSWSDWVEINLLNIGQGGGSGEGGGTTTTSFITTKKIELLSNSWENLENAQPFFYQTTIFLDDIVLTDDTQISIINDNPVLLANFGLVIGQVNNQNITFYATKVPVGDCELTLSFIKGNSIVDSNGNITILKEETISIDKTKWEELENCQPFIYQVKVTPQTQLSDKASVGIANDDPIFFARYGLSITQIIGQEITIYAIALPEDDTITITLSIMEEQ